MRKAGAIILFVATLLFANGCSEEENTENLSEKMREYVTAAVETTDDFLDGKIGGAEAVERLGNAYKAADRHYEAEEAANEGDTIGTYISNDQFAVFDILLLECEVQDKVDGTGTEEKIIEKRNDLAEKIGEKKR